MSTTTPLNGTLHLNWPKADPKPARPRNGMTAMEEAFARVGYRPAPRPPPQSPPPPDRTAAAQRRTEAIKSELADSVAAFRAMSDDDLLAEQLSIKASIDIIKIDLAEVTTDGRDRTQGWQFRAERALAFVKARYAACIAEVEARRKQQKLTSGDRVAQAKQELDRTEAEAFTRAAKVMLPKETYLAIWAAVQVGKATASTSPPPD
jgi:hypothetical protein